jgi:hypothetical protein
LARPKSKTSSRSRRKTNKTKLAGVNQQQTLSALPSLASSGLTRTDLASIHPDIVGDLAYHIVSDKMPLPRELHEAGALGALNFHKQMQPKDALEKLALTQALLAHARAAYLTKLLSDQTEAVTLGIVSEACERAAGTFTRLVRAVSEYRQPKTPTTSVSIGQANVANQQVIQNFQRREGTRKENVDEQTRIKWSGAPTAPADIPVVEKRLELTEGCNSENETLAKIHGAKNGGRQSRRCDEIAAPRSTVSRGHGAAKAGTANR